MTWGQEEQRRTCRRRIGAVLLSTCLFLSFFLYFLSLGLPCLDIKQYLLRIPPRDDDESGRRGRRRGAIREFLL